MKPTVIVTHYNTPVELMRRCIRSLEANNLEYIIVDDGSDKEFAEGLSEYKNVRYLPNNVGTYKAFGTVLRDITSQYVMRVDSDDYISGFSPIDGKHDAYVNNVHNKVSLDIHEFMRRPFAGLNGITIKTKALQFVWKCDIRRYGDIVIFARIIKNYDCVYYDTSYYVYEPRKGSITTSNLDTIQHDLDVAKKIIKDEYERDKEF